MNHREHGSKFMCVSLLIWLGVIAQVKLTNIKNPNLMNTDFILVIVNLVSSSDINFNETFVSECSQPYYIETKYFFRIFDEISPFCSAILFDNKSTDAHKRSSTARNRIKCYLSNK